MDRREQRKGVTWCNDIIGFCNRYLSRGDILYKIDDMSYLIRQLEYAKKHSEDFNNSPNLASLTLAHEHFGQAKYIINSFLTSESQTTKKEKSNG